MRPKPFFPEVIEHNAQYVRDQTDGLVWHRCENRTLYADTDRSQTVYHANYLRFFEMGRASLMRDAGCTYREIEEKGLIYPIIEVGITYHAPLYYDDAMWIHTRPGDLERVRIRFDYVITRAGENTIVCKGFTTHCAVKPSGTPVAIDSHTRGIWTHFPK